MPLRGTMFFTIRKSGWTETVYLASATHSVAMDRLKALAVVRKELNGLETDLELLRVSDIDALRDALIYKPTLVEAHSITFRQNHSVGPWEGLLQRMINVPSIWRSSFLRGIPDDVVVNGAEDTFGLPAFQGVYDLYRGVLKNGNYLLQARDRTLPKRSVLSVAQTVAQPGRTTVITHEAHGWLTDDLIKFYSRKPGEYRFMLKTLRMVATPNINEAVFDVRFTASFGAPHGLTGQKVLYTYVPITECIFERFGSRRPGRPFGLLVGKRSGRAAS